MSTATIIVLLVIAGAAAALVFILTSGTRNFQQRFPPKPTRKEIEDPVTQPIRIQTEPVRMAGDKPVVASAGTISSAEPYARLVRLSEEKMETLPGAYFFLKHPEVTIGSDPQQARIVLQFPSISPLHARFKINPEGAVVLSDEGSSSGTWVNYAPVSRQGVRLEHNDIVHFGKLVFRFELIAQPRISPTRPLPD